MKSQKRKKIVQEKIKELEKKYQERVSLNKYMWKNYGSELASGGMLKKEEKILKEIKQLKKLLTSSEIDMNDKFLKQRKEEIMDRITTIETRERELIKRKEGVKEYLTFIKSILEIK